MKSTPFDPSTDLEPVPFDEDTLRLAEKMKDAGLVFRPHAGCFVWDPQGVIEAPSPFPNRVYFILNLHRFESIFGSIAGIADQLVWVPTETQARAALSQLGASGDTATTGTMDLYHRITRRLRSAGDP